jgi:cysteine desulfurase
MLTPDKIIYLDNNATTRLDPAVIEEMQPFLTSYYGNPSSGYRFGAQVREAIDLARERVAALLGCEPAEIVFTSGGTESNNAAMNSALQFEPKGKHVVTTAVEHSATWRHCEQLAGRGCVVTLVGVEITQIYTDYETPMRSNGKGSAFSKQSVKIRVICGQI